MVGHNVRKVAGETPSRSLLRPSEERGACPVVAQGRDSKWGGEARYAATMHRHSGESHEGADGPGYRWFTITDGFDADFGVDEWHGMNVFIRDDERVFRTYFINNHGEEQMDGEIVPERSGHDLPFG